MEIEESEFDAMGQKVLISTECAYRPKDVTLAGFIDAMKEQNRCGRAYRDSLKASRP